MAGWVEGGSGWPWGRVATALATSDCTVDLIASRIASRIGWVAPDGVTLARFDWGGSDGSLVTPNPDELPGAVRVAAEESGTDREDSVSPGHTSGSDETDWMPGRTGARRDAVVAPMVSKMVPMLSDLGSAS